MALTCPRCRPIMLEELDFNDTTIDRCPRCGGLWFDNAEVAALTELKPEQIKMASIVPSEDFAEASMTCPRCDDIELRKLFFGGKPRERVLYRCISCLGTWLDRGELKDEEDPKLKETLTAYFSKLGKGNDVL